MSSSDNVARRYFDALGAHDLDAAVACWRPGGVDRLVGAQELIAPEGVRTYFSELFAAFPDFSFEVLAELVDGDHTTVRWRARATFAGPGRFQGFAPNGARLELEVCDVVTAGDGLIDHSHQADREAAQSSETFRPYWDLSKVAPPAGSSWGGCCPSGTAAPSRSRAPCRRATRSPASR